MSLPQGVFWQTIRQQALDAIPLASSVRHSAPTNLASWQSSGSYTVLAATTSKITLIVTPTDFGGALFSDAAYHLDHALEHQATLMRSLNGDQWTSPAWQVVTFYYWAYFASMALTRMMGKSLWFVTPEVAKQFSILAPAGAPNIAKGTYELICGPFVSAGSREVYLVKKKRRVHEQLWTLVFSLLRSAKDEVDANASSPEEARLFTTIIATADLLGDDWPSMFRNIVNYRPGFAYTAPRYASKIGTYSYLSGQRATITTVIDRLESNTIAMRFTSSVEDQPKVALQMLADLTILLNRMAHSLHNEVVDRSSIDKRWRNSKKRFCVEQGVLVDGVPWPC